MIRQAAQIGIHHALTSGMGRITAGWFQGYEYRIYFAENFRIVALENPASLGLVIRIKNPEASCPLVLAFFGAPHPVMVVRLCQLGFVKVVGIKHQRLPFREEDSSKRRLRFAPGIGIKYVHDM